LGKKGANVSAIYRLFEILFHINALENFGGCSIHISFTIDLSKKLQTHN